jgi:hypothetical protein
VYHNLKQEIEDNGRNLEQLDLVVLDSISVTITSGASDFNALQNIDLFISSPSEPEKKVAWMESVPTGLTVVVPDLSSENLKDY